MSSVLGGIEGLTNNFLLGYAIGRAAGPALEPYVQDLANEAWSLHPDKPPDPYTLAEGVAQGQVDPDRAAAWAKETGISGDAFTALVNIANAGPALGYAFAAWRRGELTDDEFTVALHRTGLEERWYPAIRALKQEPLDPSTIANAVHRGIMRDPTLIVREPPTTPGNVEQVPPSSIDPAEEAAWSGLDHERLRVEVGTTGLPPGLIQMLELLNRGVVTVADVQRAVSQSNLRNEYMDVVLALRRHLLTPHEYQEAALRGILTQAEADAGSALSGLEPDDAHLLFQIMGRPLAVHQITTGLARGATLGGTYADVPEPYRDAIRRSNIRPEYARLAYANRYTYPGAFVLRALAQAGELGDAAAVEQILLDIGWPPDLAAKVAPSWTGGGPAGDTHVSKAQTQLWNQTHTSYKGGLIDDAMAAAALRSAGVDAASIPGVLDVWRVERDLIRAGLSSADIRKAYRKQDVNETTGVAWTKLEAIAALEAIGWDAATASQYLDIG